MDVLRHTLVLRVGLRSILELSGRQSRGTATNGLPTSVHITHC